MVSLAEVGPRLSFPFPVLCKLMCVGIDRESLHVVLGVTTSSEEDESVPSVKERRTEIVLRGTVTIAVAPVIDISTWQWIVHPQLSVVANGIRLTCQSVQIQQVFRPRVGIGHVGSLVDGVAGVDIHIADVGCGTVGMIDDHVVGTAQQDFGFAVTVPIIAHSVILLVGAAHHVGPKVNIPQPVALDVVTFQQVKGGGIDRTAVNIVALYDEFRHPIAVDVSQSNVVDVVVVGDIAASTACHAFHGKLNILLIEACHLGTFLLLRAANDGCHLIF